MKKLILIIAIILISTVSAQWELGVTTGYNGWRNKVVPQAQLYLFYLNSDGGYLNARLSYITDSISFTFGFNQTYMRDSINNNVYNFTPYLDFVIPLGKKKK